MTGLIGRRTEGEIENPNVAERCQTFEKVVLECANRKRKATKTVSGS